MLYTGVDIFKQRAAAYLVRSPDVVDGRVKEGGADMEQKESMYFGRKT